MRSKGKNKLGAGQGRDVERNPVHRLLSAFSQPVSAFFVNGQAVDMDSTSCRKTCKRFSK